jgi:hypothetical protein
MGDEKTTWGLSLMRPPLTINPMIPLITLIIPSMEMNLYYYKLNILEGKPPRRWLVKARWYLLRTENSHRFKSVLTIIETYQIPTIVLNLRQLIVVKCNMVSEFLARMVPDLMHDAILTPEDKKALELNDYWEAEKVKLDKKGVALWKLGLQIKACEKARVARERFKAILEEIKDLKEVKV